VEVASVTDELENVSSTERAQTVTELAEAVGRRAEEYSAVLGQSSGKVSEEAAAAVVEIQEKVTETVVSEHEQQPQKETAKYLDTAFQKDILEINNRIDMVNLRLSRIETTLSNSGALTVDISNTIKIVRAAVKDFNAEINELSKIFAAGGYRTVFEKISEMKTVLTNAEGIAADLEINLTSPQE
jgi:DNA-directed RNA polymerase specialized sigma subunit